MTRTGGVPGSSVPLQQPDILLGRKVLGYPQQRTEQKILIRVFHKQDTYVSENLLLDTKPLGPPQSNSEFYMHLKDIMEGIFTSDALQRARRRGSTASRHWAFYQRMSEHKGLVTFSPDLAEIISMREPLLDGLSFLWLSKGDMEQMTLGPLDKVWEPSVLKKVQGTVDDAEQYNDVMVELSAAAWYQHQGFPVKMVQRERWPDLWVNPWSDEDQHNRQTISMDDSRLERPLLVECKRVRPRMDVSDRERAKRIKARIEEDIIDAGRKVEKASQDLGISSYGVVVIDISALFTAQEMQNQRIRTGMRQLDQAKGITRNVFSSKGCHGVNAVVFTWHGFVWAPEAPGVAHGQFIPYSSSFENAKPVVYRSTLPFYRGRGLDLRFQYHPIGGSDKPLFEGQPTHLEIRWAAMDSLGYSSWTSNKQ